MRPDASVCGYQRGQERLVVSRLAVGLDEYGNLVVGVESSEGSPYLPRQSAPCCRAPRAGVLPERYADGDGVAAYLLQGKAIAELSQVLLPPRDVAVLGRCKIRANLFGELLRARNTIMIGPS
ncbi:hypothetical protein [Streptomyces glycanivorans]|uniref:Uncharacterized protein n=1 Tax=Streptomyces glycanivorans TaxID=3033808 RepID=A0ABY9JAR6_9ACTN|nr:hypothetical protein [Streptomyces sp. Alt3]WLQ63358.1 hypothetical protein P8A20_07000 [Streptomyces sp. Alt3]